MFEAMSQFYAAVQDRQSPRKRLNGLKEKEVKQVYFYNKQIMTNICMWELFVVLIVTWKAQNNIYDWKEGRWKSRKGTLKLSTSRSDEI